MPVTDTYAGAAEVELIDLLTLAHTAITWADQCWEGIAESAGGQHYAPKREAYYRARLAYFAPRAVLSPSDVGPLYREAAAMQPWNHRFPWNCGNYWDGCNCEGGPFYDRPADA